MARVRQSGTIWKIALVAGILIAAGIIWVVQSRKAPQVQEAADVPVRVLQPEVRDLNREIKLTSWVSSQATVVVVPKVSGTLVGLRVDIGDRVYAGQEIGTVDPEAYRLTLEQARIARDGARNEYERARKLYEAGSAGKQSLDLAQTQAQAAEAQYNIARLNYDNTRVLSPVSGKIVSRPASVGALVSISTPIVTISAEGELLATVQVPERYVPYFFGPKPPKTLLAVPSISLFDVPARIQSISPQIRSDTRTFEVTCAIDGKYPALLPGMLVSVSFTLESRLNTPALPRTALDNEHRAWILDRGDMTARPVDLSRAFTDGVWVAVDEMYGRSEFISEGQRFLKEHVRVRVLEDSGALGTNGEVP